MNNVAGIFVEQCGRYICSVTYANNLKHMYTSAACHTVDGTGFI